MKALFHITAVLLLTSCSVLRKHKSSEQKAVDSVSVSVKDTLRKEVKDSLAIRGSSSENVNETVIEFDSSGGQMVVPNSDETGNKINTTDYFTGTSSPYKPGQIKGKIKKITIRNSQTENKNDLVQLNESIIQQGHKADSTKVVKSEAVNTESKSRCSFPLWSLVFLLVIAGVLYWAWRRYKSIII